MCYNIKKRIYGDGKYEKIDFDYYFGDGCG